MKKILSEDVGRVKSYMLAEQRFVKGYSWHLPLA